MTRMMEDNLKYILYIKDIFFVPIFLGCDKQHQGTVKSGEWAEVGPGADQKSKFINLSLSDPTKLINLT